MDIQSRDIAFPNSIIHVPYHNLRETHIIFYLINLLLTHIKPPIEQ